MAIRIMKVMLTVQCEKDRRSEGEAGSEGGGAEARCSKGREGGVAGSKGGDHRCIKKRQVC